MTNAENKLKQLQSCLGEKKLKQLGLIPCSTCRKIMTQVMNISLPIDLQNKSYFTSEEMSTISQTILESVNYSLNDLSSSSINSKQDLNSNLLEKDSLDPTDFSESSSLNMHSISEQDNTNESNVQGETCEESNNKEENTERESAEEDNNIIYSPGSEEELVNKLLSILNQSQHLTQGDLGIGYIYTPPIVSSFSHTLNCTECGHMYTISTQPTLKLLPLPVYLTDTEYEMIKGIYVDIFL